MSVAAYGALPANRLSLADQSFQSGVGSWVSNASGVASTLGVSTVNVFEGTQALQVTVGVTAGSSIVSSGSYSFSPSLPAIASCEFYCATAQQAQIGLSFYNGSTWVTTWGPEYTLPAGWSPLTVACVSPAGCTGVEVLVRVTSAAAGLVWGLALVYLAQSVAQILVDWTNPAYKTASIAGEAFTDITPFVNVQTSTIQITRGRQDAISEAQTGSATLTVENTSGWFTSQSAASPWNPSLGARLQINEPDESGVWHTRFDGSITQFNHDIAPNAAIAYVGLVANDVLRNLSNQQELQSWTKEVTLLDSPALHWTLDDATGALAAAESSGNNGPALTVRSYGSGTVAFSGYDGGGVETMADTGTSPGPFSSPVPAPQFTTSTSAAGYDGFGGGSAQLSAQLPFSLANSAAWSVEAWCFFDSSALWEPTSATQFMTLFSLGNTRTGYSVSVGLEPNGTSSPYAEDVILFTAQAPVWAQTQSTSTPTFSEQVTIGPGATAGVPHHVVLVCNAGVVTFYIDGVAGGPYGSTVGSVSPLKTAYSYNWLDVGGLFGGHGGWQGGISLVSVYQYALTSGQVATHWDMGQDGPYRYLSGQAIQLLAKITGTPNFWLNPNLQGGGTPNGVTPVDYVDLTGSNALTIIQEFEECELAGLLYVNAAGQLCFDSRTLRMGAGTPALTLPAMSYNPELGYKVTDQYVQTRAAISGTAYNVPAVTIDTTADTAMGQYPNGSPNSPTTIPLLMVNPQFDLVGGVSGDQVQLDPYLNDAAQWNVNRNSTPPFKAAGVTVDAISLTPGSAEYIALSALYGVEVNTTFTLGGSNIPSFPTSSGLNYFVEGVSESIGVDVHSFTFYTSPMSVTQCWIPGTGSLDSQTAILGVSNPPASAPPAAKVSPLDPGRPFMAPAYSGSMNTTGFVGAADQRGIYDTLIVRQRPPVLIAGQAIAAQSIANATWTSVLLDTVYADVSNGFSRGSNASTYTVLLPGFYDIGYVAQWAITSASSTTGSARVAVNHVGGNPVGANANFIACVERRFQTTVAMSMTGAARLYLGVGTMVTFQVWQDTAAALSLHSGTAAEVGFPTQGAMLSLKHVGYSLTAD